MRYLIIASYQCVLSLALFLLVGIAMASSDDSRVLFGEINAAVKLLRIDDHGIHYFEFKNSGEGSVYFSGYGKSSPIYSTQVLDETGLWQKQASGFFCGTGLDVFELEPGDSVFFESTRSGDAVKVGIGVSTDPVLMIKSKVVWSNHEAML